VSGASPADAALSRQRLGIKLRELRQSRALRLADVAAELGIVGSTLSRIENGKAPARASYIRVLLDLYQVSDPGQRQAIIELASQGLHGDWCADAADLLSAEALRFIGLEAAAEQIRVFSAHVIPDLLQTREYAAAAWRATRPGLTLIQADRLADVTAHRQKALGGDGRRVHAVIDEAALLRPVGDPQVMAAQLDHLAWAATADRMTVEILPLAEPWPAISPPFTILSFGDLSNTQTARIGVESHAVLTSHDKAVRLLCATFDALARASLSSARSAHLIAGVAKQQ